MELGINLPSDLLLVLRSLAIGAPIGMVIGGVFLLLYHSLPGVRKWYSGGKPVPWYWFAVFAVFFMALALGSVLLDHWTFAACFWAFAALEVFVA